MTESAASRQFCVEMETGTGKTCVYTKTILELNWRYGFTKFIAVAPSVAIRKAVFKSFQLTEEHFALQCDSVPCRYNSAKLSDVRQFATSGNIEVMIINIDAFKKVNLLYRLTPVEAYQMGLVKQITVSSNQMSEPYVRLNKQVMLSPEFLELWEKIKQKTTDAVHFVHS